MNQRQKSRPIFHQVPAWLGSFQNRSLTPNNPEFHFYISQDQLSQPVTLQIPDGDQGHRSIKMYYNIEREEHKLDSESDQSPIKDFSHLDKMEAEQHSRIQISKDELIHDSSWVRKYQPKRFFDLLTDQLHNRNVITWLKSWDQIVFKRQSKKFNSNVSNVSIFRKGMPNTKPNGYIPQEFSYKKLILLAGPPGCGKTTLARVVAKHCGYHWQEINASDDRSAKTLITKIDNLVTNKTVGREQKPICVIIDEVDGALDSESNGIKDLLQYIETGVVPGEKIKVAKPKKGEKQAKGSKANAKQQQKKKQPKAQLQNQADQRKSKIGRPIIFICNDPFVRGLKQLRGKAIVVYFNPLQEDRVVKRLKEISDAQGVYIESELLAKICQMCNNDVRSSVSVLQMVVKFKKQQGINPKDFLNRLKFSFAKDTATSTNQFLQKLNSSKADPKTLFSNYQHLVQEHGNPTILCQTFFHNLTHHKHVFYRLQVANKLYRELLNYDMRMKANFGQHDDFSMLLFAHYRVSYKHDDHKKFQFPSIYFERFNKLKNNRALLEKIFSGFAPLYKIFASKQTIVQEYLYLLWLTLQTSSTREDDVLRCVYKMITYGFKLAHRAANHIFIPEIDQLLTFGSNKPQIALSNTTRTLMQENYEFLKMKSQLLTECMVEGRQSYEDVINQLKRNRRRIRHSQGGVVKYKYLQGTGTEIKYDIKIAHFFDRKALT